MLQLVEHPKHAVVQLVLQFPEQSVLQVLVHEVLQEPPQVTEHPPQPVEQVVEQLLAQFILQVVVQVLLQSPLQVVLQAFRHVSLQEPPQLVPHPPQLVVQLDEQLLSQSVLQVR